MSRRSLLSCSAIALVVLLAACGGGSDKKATTADAKAKPAAKAKAAPPVAPLTGKPDPTGAANKRCAVTVKIDNTRASQPKYGVNLADVVYEEVVEGGYTRLAAIFNSQAPDRVGSVRSVRLSDQLIVAPIRGIFAYSGGAPYAINSINTAPVVQLDENRAGNLMFRDHSRNAPLNLYANVGAMYARCKDPAPPPLYSYRPTGATTPGTPVTSVRVGFLGSFPVTWTWDAASGSWIRTIFGERETGAGAPPIAPQNVIVMPVPYKGGDPRPQYYLYGAEAQLVGSGKVQVFTNGKQINGTWSRPDKSKPATLVDATGKTILLTPGQTWVQLPEPQYPVTVTPAAAPPATTP
jgi:hypothetical protein